MPQKNVSSILKIVRPSLTILSVRKRLIRVPMGIGVSFQTLQMRISVLPHRIMHVPTLLIRMLLVMWGPSTQAGFAEYRLIVKEKANQVEDTANKESEKLSKGAETVDQTKRVTPKVIEGSSLVKPTTAIQLSNSQVIILPQAQIQETQVSSSAETLPNTGSDESVSATLAGLVLVTLAGFFGIKKYEKN